MTQESIIYHMPQAEDALPSKEELDNLGPGCYVQVKSEHSLFWVEITEVKGDLVAGRIHCELGDKNDTSQSDLQKVGIIQFNKKRICNLGCDNYCWC